MQLRKGDTLKYDIEYYKEATGSLMSHDEFEAKTEEEAKEYAVEFLAGYAEADYALVDDTNGNLFAVYK